MEAAAAGRPLVKGEISIQPGARAFDHATIHVYLEDSSLADAPAVILAEVVIPAVRHTPALGATHVPFTLGSQQAVKLDERRYYNVRVWVDCNSDGETSHEDLYSDQVYPVLTRGFGDTVIIKLGPEH